MNQIFFGSAADHADVHLNDVVVRIDGEDIKSRSDLYAKIAGINEGDTIICTLFRDGSLLEKEITLTYVATDRLKSWD